MSIFTDRPRTSAPAAKLAALVLFVAGAASPARAESEAERAEREGIEAPVAAKAPEAAKVSAGPRGAAPAVAGGMLLVPESTNDRVMLLSAADGSVVNADFIVDPTNLSTPICAISVGAEVWVSDQLDDAVRRYDGTTGAFLGTVVAAGLDNLRGIDFSGGILHVCNAGSANGAPGEAIVQFDSAGTLLGSFAVDSPFDILPLSGEFAVAESDLDRIGRYTTAGVFLASIAPIDAFPEQIAIRPSTGLLLVANFSGTQTGIIEIDPSTGTVVNLWTAGMSDYRGVAELDNGLILATNSLGVHTIDPTTGNLAQTIVAGVSGRFIEPYAVVPVGLSGFEIE